MIMIIIIALIVASIVVCCVPRREGGGKVTPGGSKATSSLITGLVLAGLGIVLLLDRFGIVNAEHIWNFWPLVFVVPGLIKLSSPGSVGDRVWGSFLVLVGAVLILHEFGRFPYGLNYLWPLFLVVAGLLLMWQSYQAKHDGTVVSGDDDVRVFSVFGGSEQHINSQHFRGGQLVAVFGGYQLDLTQAEIEGNQAVLDATSVFGGGEIHIPRHWNVAMKGIGIFGGYGDETGKYARDTTKPAKTLVVKGVAMFGGVSVKF
jgi:predicted membrane protein